MHPRRKPGSGPFGIKSGCYVAHAVLISATVAKQDNVGESVHSIAAAYVGQQCFKSRLLETDCAPEPHVTSRCRLDLTFGNELDDWRDERLWNRACNVGQHRLQNVVVL